MIIGSKVTRYFIFFDLSNLLYQAYCQTFFFNLQYLLYSESTRKCALLRLKKIFPLAFPSVLNKHISLKVSHLNLFRKN